MFARDPHVRGSLQDREDSPPLELHRLSEYPEAVRAPAGSIEIGEERRSEGVILRPRGNIDNDTSAAFQTRVLAAIASAPNAVVIDLGGVDYISSAGLRVLMMAAKQAKTASGRLGVASLKPVVEEIFTISRFRHVVQVFETADAAFAAWR
jgi:anti-anti-sigma factor